MLSILVLTSLFITGVQSTILSDTSCSCALVKSPNNNASFAVGCAVKPSWTGVPIPWCFTDQTNGVCGINQTGYGIVDMCANAGFPSVNLSSQMLYSNQNLTVSWTTQNILPDELVKISVGRFVLTPGQGINATSGIWNGKIPNSVSVVNTPVLLSTVSSPSVLLYSTQNLTVLTSSLTNPAVYNNLTLAGTGANGVAIVGQNLTIKWLGSGDAASGTASVSITSSFGGGGGTTVGTPLTGLPVVPGNMSAAYNLPRSFVPGFGGTTYLAKITVISISGSTYTLSSSSFSLTAGPSQTSTPSATPTQTPTPTPSLSTGSTPSNTATPSTTISITPTPSTTPSTTPSASLTVGYTPSVTATQTPTISDTASNTPTPSITPSTTPSPTPPVDLKAIQAAALSASNAQTQMLVGAIIGGLVATILLGLGVYKLYQRHDAQQRRERKLRAASRRNISTELSSVYGMQPTVSVVYQQDIYRSNQQAHVGRGSNPRNLTYQQQRRQGQQTSSV